MRIGRRGFLTTIVPALLARPHFGRADGPGPVGDEGGEGDGPIVGILRGVFARDKVPGLTAAIVATGHAARVGAVGLRKKGSPRPFGAGDLVHLGSDTKAMTATMIATMVEEGKLSWTTPLGEVVPDPAMHEGFRAVTLDELLTHRAGLPADGNWWMLGAGKTTTEQRRVLLGQVTRKAPDPKPGTAFRYSNVGYALAGLMAETVSATSWEDLMRQRIFRPLGMASAGFGAPGTKGKVDQPWGHSRSLGGGLVPSQIDNAPALGPAGTVHCTMADWTKFADLHLNGARGAPTPILKPETFRALQTPPPGGDYAKGWSVVERPWAGGTALTHAGSNTQWFCVAWLAPQRGLTFLAATNQGGESAQTATDQAVAALIALTDDEKAARGG